MSKSKILYIATGISWIFVFFVSFDTMPLGLLENYIFLITLVLSCLSVVIYLINREKNKEVWSSNNNVKKSISIFVILISGIFVGLVSFLLELYIYGAAGNSIS